MSGGARRGPAGPGRRSGGGPAPLCNPRLGRMPAPGALLRRAARGAPGQPAEGPPRAAGCGEGRAEGAAGAGGSRGAAVGRGVPGGGAVPPRPGAQTPGGPQQAARRAPDGARVTLGSGPGELAARV